MNNDDLWEIQKKINNNNRILLKELAKDFNILKDKIIILERLIK